jgi:hypothetical protein
MSGLRRPVARCQTGGRVLADRSLSRLLREDWPCTVTKQVKSNGLPPLPQPKAVLEQHDVYDDTCINRTLYDLEEYKCSIMRTVSYYRPLSTKSDSYRANFLAIVGLSLFFVSE